MRCLRFFLRGAFWRKPAPYHRDFRCYSIGMQVSSWAVVWAIIASVFGLGWLLS